VSKLDGDPSNSTSQQLETAGCVQGGAAIYLCVLIEPLLELGPMQMPLVYLLRVCIAAAYRREGSEPRSNADTDHVVVRPCEWRRPGDGTTVMWPYTTAPCNWVSLVQVQCLRRRRWGARQEVSVSSSRSAGSPDLSSRTPLWPTLLPRHLGWASRPLLRVAATRSISPGATLVARES